MQPPSERDATQRPTKPLLGFGWIGWCLLPVAAALAWTYVGGYDLRFVILKWVNDGLGWGALSWVVSVWLPGQSFSLREPVLGPVVLLYLLPAMHIHPRRFGWWYGLLAVWAIFRPAMIFIVSSLHLGSVLGAWWTGQLASGRWVPSWELPICAMLLAWGDAALLFALTRSWVVATVVAIITVGFVMAEWIVPQYSGAMTNWATGLPWDWMWNISACAALTWWAVRARRSVRQPWECQPCGYDLRGGSGAVCPECGTAVNSVRSAGTLAK